MTISRLPARQYLLLVLLYLIAPAEALLPVEDPDIWWHLRTGQWIVEHGWVPTTDPFSAHGAGQPWVAYSWLFELLVYGLYSHFGLSGLVLYTLIGALTVTASLHLLVRRAGLPFGAEILLTAVAAFCLKPQLTPRPWLFSILFFTLLLHALVAYRTSGNLRPLYFLPVIFLFWANLHIQFIYGLALVFLFVAEPLFHKLVSSWLTTDLQPGVSPAKPQSAPRNVEVRGSTFEVRSSAPHTFRGRRSAVVGPPFRDHKEYLSGATRLTKRFFGFLVQPGRHDGQLRLILIVVLCLGATLVTPYHVYLYRPIFEYALQTRVFQNIAEFHPMFFREPQNWLVLALALGTAFILGWRRETRPFPYMLLIMGAFLAFRARRDTWVLVVASLAIITEQQMKTAFESAMILSPRRLVAVTAGVMVSLLAIGYYRDISAENLTSHVAKRFPVNAVRFVKNNQEHGPLYNHLDWGGYLIWELPQIPVSMDGRTNLHGEERIERSLATWSAYPGWSGDPELGQARLIIAEIHRPLTSLLRTDSRFRLAYSDDVAAVFVAREK